MHTRKPEKEQTPTLKHTVWAERRKKNKKATGKRGGKRGAVPTLKHTVWAERRQVAHMKKQMARRLAAPRGNPCSSQASLPRTRNRVPGLAQFPVTKEGSPFQGTRVYRGW